MAISLRPVDQINYRDVLELSVVDAIVEIVRKRGLPTIRLSVLTDNDQAIEFYRRNGFAATGETEGDEIVMERAV